MDQVRASHDAMLETKRTELLEVVRQCMAEIHQAAEDGSQSTKAVSDKADTYYSQQKEKIVETESLALMEGFPIPMWNYRDNALDKIEVSKKPPKPVTPKPVEPTPGPEKPAPKKSYKPIFRQSLLKTARLESDAEIDAYVDKLREQLKILLKGSDGIDLK